MAVTARTAAIRVLGSRPVERAVTYALRRRLRIVTYHEIHDPVGFRRHMEHVARAYHPVGEADVLRAVAGTAPLPERAVWTTFDDGHPGVVAVAQPILDALGIRATAFVCPAVIGTAQPLWWHVLEDAAAAGLAIDVDGQPTPAASTITHLKALPDDHRRAIVERTAEALRQAGSPVGRQQLGLDDLRGWLAAGHAVGNHTWDHPCLDRCRPDEQDRQVASAHGWLAEHLPAAPVSFAYPNGNWAEGADRSVKAHGYRLAVLFDHRLAPPRPRPHTLSRIAVDDTASAHEQRARLSGALGLARAARAR